MGQNGAMGALSSAGGVAIVVPAHFIFAGILLYTAMVAAVVGIYRRRMPLYFAFAATCFFSAGVTTSLASYYVADSVAGGVDAIRVAMDSAILFVASMFAFIAIYTETPRMRPWYWLPDVPPLAVPRGDHHPAHRDSVSIESVLG